MVGEQLAPRKGSEAPVLGFLLMVYAVALTVTPEFDFQGIPKVRLTDLLLPLLLVVALAWRGRPRSPIPLLVPMGLILLWDACVLLVVGQAQLTPGIYYLGKRVAYFVVYGLAVSWARSGGSWSRVVKAMVFSSPLLAVSVQWEQVLHGGDTDFRASGIIRDQEQSTAYFLVLILALALGLWPVLTRTAERWGLAIALGAALKTLFATGTRGGLVLLAILGGMLLPRAGRALAPLLMLLLGLAYLSWIVTPAGVQERLATLEEESQTAWVGITEGPDRISDRAGDSSTAVRLVAARDVLQYYIAQSPLEGYGAGYKPLGFDDDQYLTEWLYHGVIGLGLWLWFQVGVGYQLWRARERLTDPRARGFAAAVMAAWTAFSVGGFVADTYYLIRPSEGFFLVAGLVTGLTPATSPVPRPVPRLRPAS